jgi:hypothetical protein
MPSKQKQRTLTAAQLTTNPNLQKILYAQLRTLALNHDATWLYFFLPFLIATIVLFQLHFSHRSFGRLIVVQGREPSAAAIFPFFVPVADGHLEHTPALQEVARGGFTWSEGPLWVLRPGKCEYIFYSFFPFPVFSCSSCLFLFLFLIILGITSQCVLTLILFFYFSHFFFFYFFFFFFLFFPGHEGDTTYGRLLFSAVKSNSILKFETTGTSRHSHFAGCRDRDPARHGLTPCADLVEPGTNGLAYNPTDGYIYACEHGTRAVTRLERNGELFFKSLFLAIKIFITINLTYATFFMDSIMGSFFFYKTLQERTPS